MKTLEKTGTKTLLRILVPCFVASMFLSAAPAKQPLSKTTPTLPLITVCHFGHSLKVSVAAVSYHLSHGDQLGSCIIPTPTD